MRRSELLGLKFENIDFDEEKIYIKEKILYDSKEGRFKSDKTLKTDKSRRTMPFQPGVAELFRNRQKRIAENKAKYGNAYNNEFDGYVWVDDLGNLYKPQQLTKVVPEICRKIGIKEINLHGLRHSCATILLQSGANMKVVQDWLGHANYKTTADTYSHVEFETKRQAVKRLAKYKGELGAKINDQTGE